MIFISILLAASAIFLIAERSGARTTLHLSIKGDIKRESRFLSQYGQMVCTAIVAVVVWQLDPDRSRKGRIVPAVAAVLLASVIAMFLKRLLGRVRPGYERAGKFIGPIWRHANEHESFPSSHSACAFALSAGLAWIYPGAAGTFWTLAAVTAVLRYLMDAHWPSDVLAGIALGYACAEICWWYCITLHPNW